jgi:hypothetical protein
MEESGALARAKAIREKSRIKIVGAEGTEILIMRPSILTLIEAGVDPIVADVNADPKIRKRAIEKQFGNLNKNITKLTPLASKLLEKVMLEPKFWAGEASECPDDAVTATDLGNDFIILATQVLAIAAGTDVKEAASVAAKFRVDPDGEAGQ